VYLIPEWEGWSLAEISDNPTAVKAWHDKIAKHSEVIAGKCGKLLRACYRYNGRLRRDLLTDQKVSAWRIQPISGIDLDQYLAGSNSRGLDWLEGF
jgi:hypothetical protein